MKAFVLAWLTGGKTLISALTSDGQPVVFATRDQAEEVQTAKKLTGSTSIVEVEVNITTNWGPVQ